MPGPEKYKSFNNVASGIAALCGVLLSIAAWSTSNRITKIDQDFKENIKNLELNQGLSQLVNNSIQHLSQKEAKRDIAVLAISSALVGNDSVEDRHRYLLSYRITKRMIRNFIEGLNPLLKQGQNKSSEALDQESLELKILLQDVDILFEKNFQAAINLDEIIKSYSADKKKELRKKDCDLAEELDSDVEHKCPADKDFSYLEDARRFKIKSISDLSAYIEPLGSASTQSQSHDTLTSNLARKGINKILNISSDVSGFVIISRDINTVTQKDAEIYKSFLESKEWVIPEGFKDLPEGFKDLPETEDIDSSIVLYYGKENESYAEKLINEINQNNANFPFQAPLKKVDISLKKEDVSSDSNGKVTEIPDGQLELYLVGKSD